MHHRFMYGAGALALSLDLAGCGSTEADEQSVAPAAEATTTSAVAEPGADAALTVSDTWVKAVPDIGAQEMTGVFGTLKNPGAKDVTIVSAANSVSAHSELHETVDKDGEKVMQQVEKFVIKAGEERELRPGGDHVMVMRMDKPLNTGEEVTITLATEDGQNVEFAAVAKPFAGADERYTGESATPTGIPTQN